MVGRGAGDGGVGRGDLAHGGVVQDRDAGGLEPEGVVDLVAEFAGEGEEGGRHGLGWSCWSGDRGCGSVAMN